MSGGTGYRVLESEQIKEPVGVTVPSGIGRPSQWPTHRQKFVEGGFNTKFLCQCLHSGTTPYNKFTVNEFFHSDLGLCALRKVLEGLDFPLPILKSQNCIIGNPFKMSGKSETSYWGLRAFRQVKLADLGWQVPPHRRRQLLSRMSVFGRVLPNNQNGNIDLVRCEGVKWVLHFGEVVSSGYMDS